MPILISYAACWDLAKPGCSLCLVLDWGTYCAEGVAMLSTSWHMRCNSCCFAKDRRMLYHLQFMPMPNGQNLPCRHRRLCARLHEFQHATMLQCFRALSMKIVSLKSLATKLRNGSYWVNVAAQDEGIVYDVCTASVSNYCCVSALRTSGNIWEILIFADHRRS